MRSVRSLCAVSAHRMSIGSLALILPLVLALDVAADQPPRVREPYFGIRAVDEQTGRGVPLVELRTVNEIVLHTDSAGWIAFHEPGLMGREVYFGLSSPGYQYPADGFGNRGVRLTPAPGAAATVELRRMNLGERLYRITGQGVYRDSALLGLPTPAGVPLPGNGPCRRPQGFYQPLRLRRGRRRVFLLEDHNRRLLRFRL